MFGPFQSLNSLHTGSGVQEWWFEKRFDVIHSLIYSPWTPEWAKFMYLAVIQMYILALRSVSHYVSEGVDAEEPVEV